VTPKISNGFASEKCVLDFNASLEFCFWFKNFGLIWRRNYLQTYYQIKESDSLILIQKSVRLLILKRSQLLFGAKLKRLNFFLFLFFF